MSQQKNYRLTSSLDKKMTSSSINFQKNLLKSETKKENPKLFSEKKIRKNGNSPSKMNQKFKPDPFSPIPKRIQPKLI